MLNTIDGERVVVDDALSGGVGSGDWLLSEAMLSQGMTNTVETSSLKPTTKAKERKEKETPARHPYPIQ